MVKNSLTPYRILITNLGTKEQIPLKEIKINNHSFIELVKVFLESKKKPVFSKENNKGLYIEKIDYSEDNPIEIFGIVKTGEYGFSADYINTKTGKITKNARRSEDAEVLPFFYHIYQSQLNNSGILILQKFSIYSTKTVFLKTIEPFFEHYSMKITIEPMISHKLMEKITDSRICEISCVQYDVPTDKATQLLKISRSGDFSLKKKVVSFVAKRNTGLIIKDALMNRICSEDTQNNENQSYFTIFDEDYDELKILVDIDGSKETLSVKPDEPSFREKYHLPSNIKMIDGHPEYESIKLYSKSYLKRIRKADGETL